MKSLLNPFSVKTPETMTAQEVVDLFVPVGEYFDIQNPGHVFVHGHRGCGKSMMFRLMSPDCQVLYRSTNLHALPYYGVYLSIKATDLNIPEFHRLDGQLAGLILGEHTLVGYLTAKTLQSLAENFGNHIDESGKIEELKTYCDKSLVNRLRAVGWTDDGTRISEGRSAREVLSSFVEIFDSIHARTIQYLKRLTFTTEIAPFSGPLLGFQDFLLPALRDLRQLSFMPEGSIYLLIDDADNLNLQQTQVLNTWVSYRTTGDVSLKISTQLNYKTHLTTSGLRIEAPHDYSEINVSGIYTGPAKEKYPQWVKDIVGKRLELCGIGTSSEAFFPWDTEQEQEIERIAQEYIAKWTPESGGYRPRDDAYRNARPEYIKRLHQTRQGHRYSYSGFEQLVHISSGIIRFFLDPASQMFSQEENNSRDEGVERVSPQTQDKIIREVSDQIMLSDFDERFEDVDNFDHTPESAQKMKKLRNLIITMGAMFHELLISERAERKYFSFAISDEPDEDVRAVLRLGVQNGYFYESSIGTKEGMGRTRLYVLTRRLAPFFKLDPTGFSGHKFVTNSFLRAALDRPKSTQSKMKSRGVDAVLNEEQQSLDFAEDKNED
jgi:hypothetical protein